MKIEQWEDKGLAHFSYAILSESEKEIILVDPSRDPGPYLEFARNQKARITGIIETHPHADFVSSHLELHRVTGATIYTSQLVDAYYPHESFDEGQHIQVGELRLSALNTPGHSPDSICVLLEEDGKQKAVFTGDTLFIGDCGRPDLREGAGKIQLTRKELARKMYHSLRSRLMTLENDVAVYPAHGAGTLCGKALSSAHSSTIGAEKISNWSLQEQTEEEFVESLLADQPFIPAYFPYDVELNRKGAPGFEESVHAIKMLGEITSKEDSRMLDESLWIIDARDEKVFKKGHMSHSINLMEGNKFETWLGSIIPPGERFYLAGSSTEQLRKLIARAAAIGYESFIEAAFVLEYGDTKMPKLDTEAFENAPDQYTIIDVRNPSEVKEGKIFSNSLSIPLAELRNRVSEVPTDKPVVVHCAGGYRSAAASSLVEASVDGKVKVFDLGEAVKDFSNLAKAK